MLFEEIWAFPVQSGMWGNVMTESPPVLSDGYFGLISIKCGVTWTNQGPE